MTFVYFGILFQYILLNITKYFTLILNGLKKLNNKALVNDNKAVIPIFTRHLLHEAIISGFE